MDVEFRDWAQKRNGAGIVQDHEWSMIYVDGVQAGQLYWNGNVCLTIKLPPSKVTAVHDAAAKYLERGSVHLNELPEVPAELLQPQDDYEPDDFD